MGSPLRRRGPRKVQVVLAQSAVSVRADVFDLRTSEKHAVAPRPFCDRHTEAPQANATAVTLVPYGQIDRSGKNQKTQHQRKIAGQKRQALRERSKFVLLRRKDVR